MLQKILLFATNALLLFFLLISGTYAETVDLKIPIVEDSPKQHLFFHELLNTALIEAGHTPNLIVEELPQSRIKHYLDLGGLSIYWMIESAERNDKYLAIDTDLTNGLIGKRILFIKKEEQSLYSKVKTLDDFRNLNLIGGMGKGWFDVNVWKENNLKYMEQSGSWRSIFERLPVARDLDYFSRGINEILTEAIHHPELAIEDRLVLIYDRDFRFYLSKEGRFSGRKYQQFISSALKQAKESGLIDRLVEKHWGYDFRVLGYDDRIKIHLKTPE